MTHPATHSKNTSQYPGHVVTEGKQKRHTSEQKQADDAEVDHAQQKQAACHEKAINQLAGIICYGIGRLLFFFLPTHVPQVCLEETGMISC